MSNKVYVGNLPYSFTNDDLRNLFAAFGPVRLAEVIIDRMTNRSRGFGFVEMETSDAMQQVIQNLHDTELQGRRLTVNEARERAPGGPGGGGGPRAYSGPRPSGGFGAGPGGPRPGGGFGGQRPSGGGGGIGAPRPAGGFGGGGGGYGGGGGRGGPARGGGRPKRDEGDRWSDGGGGGGRGKRRRDDDYGDE